MVQRGKLFRDGRPYAARPCFRSPAFWFLRSDSFSLARTPHPGPLPQGERESEGSRCFVILCFSRKGRRNRRALAASLSFASPAKGEGTGGFSLLRCLSPLPLRERPLEGRVRGESRERGLIRA